jgi:hypothetical protein
MLLPLAIAHGKLLSRVPNNGNLSPLAARFSGRPWLTLQGRFAHKRADREPAIGSRY